MKIGMSLLQSGHPPSWSTLDQTAALPLMPHYSLTYSPSPTSAMTKLTSQASRRLSGALPKSTGHRQPAFIVSPPADWLPRPVFDDSATTDDAFKPSQTSEGTLSASLSITSPPADLLPPPLSFADSSVATDSAFGESQTSDGTLSTSLCVTLPPTDWLLPLSSFSDVSVANVDAFDRFGNSHDTLRASPTMSSPPAAWLPPLELFEHVSHKTQSRSERLKISDRVFNTSISNGITAGGKVLARAPDNTYDATSLDEGVSLPATHIKYFRASVVSPDNESPTEPMIMELYCGAPYSDWATAQWTFDYIFMLITSSMEPESYIERYSVEYLDVVFKLSSVIHSIGKMPDGMLPPSFFQGFYHLRRLFPNGLLDVEQFKGEAGSSLVLRLFVLGNVVANQAIFGQRDLKKNWSVRVDPLFVPSLISDIYREEICGLQISFVEELEVTSLSALHYDVFDLAEDRDSHLDWLRHLGYNAEFHHFRRGYRSSYLRSVADLIALALARATSLPDGHQRSYGHLIYLPDLANLSSMLCWDLSVTPFQPLAHPISDIDIAYITSPVPQNPMKSMHPTAADVLAMVAEGCTHLLYPLHTCTNYYTVQASSGQAIYTSHSNS
ncbi:hypothetical protein B0H10DRAFT_395044 [Mycena sp. CBHHK59/15]|nr:hypothetical protein B0H10DRAFT_395044 [Mycena sp. CBHHK59/15]